MSNSVNVLVVDDNALLRLGLTGAISIEPGLELAGTATTGDEALNLYKKLKPDVVIMDYQMPGMDGVECTKRIIDKDADAKIILLSAFDVEELVWRAVQAGVKGYLTKKAGEVEDVLEAIQEVANGGTYFPAGIAEKLKRRSQQRELTDREMNVLQLLADGCSNKEMADRLGLSLPTVKLHIFNLREKLDAADRTQAVANAFRRGILQP